MSEAFGLQTGHNLLRAACICRAIGFSRLAWPEATNGASGGATCNHWGTRAMCSSFTSKLFSAAGLIAVCVGPGAAGAAAIVGKATQITDSVTGGSSAKLGAMKVNDPVFLQQTVRTNASGEGRFTLDENTYLTVFSRSSIKAARFATTNVVMTTADGTFAVTTGSLPPGSYRVDTSAGTLTPHGTVFSFGVHGGRLTLGVRHRGGRLLPGACKSKAYCVDAVPGRSVVGQAGAPATGPRLTPAEPRMTPPTTPVRVTQNPPGGPWPTNCNSPTGPCHYGGSGLAAGWAIRSSGSYGCAGRGWGWHGGRQCGTGSGWSDGPRSAVVRSPVTPFFGGGGRNMAGFGFGGLRRPYHGGF